MLAEGRHIFGRRPKPRAAKPRDKPFRAGHYKDLTETGNRARKVSGTQGSYYSVKEHLFVCSSFSVSIIACVADVFFIFVRKVRD